jgi:hypothetical protein
MEDLAPIIGLLTTAQWAIAGKCFVVAFLAFIALELAAILVSRYDMRDGKRDWPMVDSVLFMLGQILSFMQAVARILPFKLPFVGIIDKLRELGSIHPDDGSL